MATGLVYEAKELKTLVFMFRSCPCQILIHMCMSVEGIPPQLVLVSSHESTKLDEMTQMQGGHMLSWSQQSRGESFLDKGPL